ncbi:hypothetical protein HMPREF9623_01944 [Stomatobaculum longum]|uniref:N-acetyltransferase domain-containing protein n=1 Tax=Stomatobaculum longum TaxID=796942 RepID=A0AA36Y389_9FIRM|nr:GNAT family N-acetyltransferase [Stomatobaculum longum]EHO15623.1 hypothetical protein HMPREF9623_01944 [Stomatobaculum longum]
MHIETLGNDTTSCLTALRIYNSNPDFLLHHLGQEQISLDFIDEERREAAHHGFGLCLISVQECPLGILDYMQRPDGYVYLSLLMLDASAQRQGLGRRAYLAFETLVRRRGATRIRIDVVNDYEPNLLPFWQKLGFIGTRTDSLCWGAKRSQILVMEKQLR